MQEPIIIKIPNAGHLQKTHQEVMDKDGKIVNIDYDATIHHLQKHYFGKKVVCKYCKSIKIYKKGKRDNGAQRWYCRDCKKTFQYKPFFSYPCIKCGRIIVNSKTLRKKQCDDCRKNERKQHWEKYKKKYLVKFIKLGSTSCNLYEKAIRKSNGEIDFNAERKKIDKELVRVFKFNGSHPYNKFNYNIWLMK